MRTPGSPALQAWGRVRSIWAMNAIVNSSPRVISLTPAVFHLSEAVNQVSRTYGDNPIVPRGPRLKPLIDRVRHGIRDALGTSFEPVLLTGTGSTAMAAVLGS